VHVCVKFHQAIPGMCRAKCKNIVSFFASPGSYDCETVHSLKKGNYTYNGTARCIKIVKKIQ